MRPVFEVAGVRWLTGIGDLAPHAIKRLLSFRSLASGRCLTTATSHVHELFCKDYVTIVIDTSFCDDTNFLFGQSLSSFRTFAGLPTYTWCPSRSFVTTLPAPTIRSLSRRNPCKTVAFVPTKARSPISTEPETLHPGLKTLKEPTRTSCPTVVARLKTLKDPTSISTVKVTPAVTMLPWPHFTDEREPTKLGWMRLGYVRCFPRG